MLPPVYLIWNAFGKKGQNPSEPYETGLHPIMQLTLISVLAVLLIGKINERKLNIDKND